MGNEWYVWSMEHSAWWGPHHEGYFISRTDAGLYSYEEAKNICRTANQYLKDVPHEAMIHISAFKI